MRQLKLDGNDLDLSTGKLVIVEGVEAIAQKLRIGLRIFLGEFFADLDAGVPYFEKILVKNPRLGQLTALVKLAILSCEGVASVDSLSVRFDATTRNLTVDFKAKAQTGELIPVKESFVIGLVA